MIAGKGFRRRTIAGPDNQTFSANWISVLKLLWRCVQALFLWYFLGMFGDVIWEYFIASYAKTIVTMKVEKTVPAAKNRGRWSFREEVSPQADWVVAECQTSPSIPGHKVLKHDTLTLHCTQYAFDMVEMAEICFWHRWNDRDIFEVGSPVPWVTLAHWLEPRGHLRRTNIAVSTHVMLNTSRSPKIMQKNIHSNFILSFFPQERFLLNSPLKMYPILSKCTNFP